MFGGRGNTGKCPQCNGYRTLEVYVIDYRGRYLRDLEPIECDYCKSKPLPSAAEAASEFQKQRL